jgi:hypothetical protein
MSRFLRNLRGALGIAATWGVSWALIGATLSIITGIVDPPSIDAGEGPLPIGAIFGAVGAISGFAFGLVMSFAERRRSLRDLSIGRAALWGVLGAAALPLLTTMNNSILIFVCPLGAAFAAASVALARRASRIEGADPLEVIARGTGDRLQRL